MTSFVSRIQDWFAGIPRRAELSRFSDVELSRIASDAGVSVRELSELSGRGPDAAALLPRRMRALDLDPDAVARQEPATLRDMERLCSLCSSHGRCERDLNSRPGDRGWRSYCPNAATLQALR